MQHSQKQLKPRLENSLQLNIIQQEANEMILIQQEISQKSQNLEELFDSLTDNKLGELNYQNLTLRSHKNLNKPSFEFKSKKLFRKKGPRRQDNTITSNTVRLLKLCIKQTFLKQRHIYESFMNQVWAFDAILIYVLYMRDETKQIDNDLFKSLSGLVLERLMMIEHRSNNQLIKQRIVRYRSHCQLYFHENRNFRKLSHMNDEIHDFFSSLISKKKLVISHCMEQVKKIIRSIQNQQFDSKISYQVKKTRKTRADSSKIK